MSAYPDSGATSVDPLDTTTHDASQGAPDNGDRSRTQPANADVQHDRIRWSAVWTGTLTTLSIYIVLQLLFFALGWLDLGINGAPDGTTRAVVSGVLGLIAFFLGGVAAGASALWRRANDGMVNGVVMWTATVLVLLTLALIGGGTLLGSLADVTTQFGDLRSAGSGIDIESATQTARNTASWAVLGLGLSVIVSALGGSIGAKLWPGRGRRDSHYL
jgi:uncharacterized membrane protein (DUF485 family)